MLPVIWSLPAETSFVETISFLHELSDTVASRLIEEVQETIQKVLHFNKACPPSVSKPQYRRYTLLDGRVSMYYRVKKTQIEIIAVRDNRRKPKF